MDFTYQLTEFDDGSTALMKVGGMVGGFIVASGKQVVAVHDLDISDDVYRSMRELMATHDIKYNPDNKHFTYIERKKPTQQPSSSQGHQPDHNSGQS